MRSYSAKRKVKKTLYIVVMFALLSGQAFGMPSYDEVRRTYRSSDALLLDRHGEVIHELRVDPSGRRLTWTDLADISPALVKAVLRSEDKRFYEHHGADWMALSAAAFGHLLGSDKRGASTITMQLASLLDGKLKSKKGRRSISQKWAQIKVAEEIEKGWTKDRILEA